MRRSLRQMYTAATCNDGAFHRHLPIQSPPEIFNRMIQKNSFDVAEMSVSLYMTRRSEGDFPFVALPIFPSRMFRHGFIFCRKSAGINHPADLNGKKIGFLRWVQTAAIWSRHNKRNIDFCLANDVPTLVWAANLADLELHTSLSLASAIDRPTTLVFDLDPGAPATIVDCCKVGLWVRDLFEGVGLESFAKTSGSKGLQVYVPLNVEVGYDDTKPFAKAVAELLEKQHPKLVVSRMTKSLRRGKVLVDWSQNDDHKTTVCVYSLRAKERPTVSTPVTWEEVEQAARKRSAKDTLVFDSTNVLERVEEMGDLFAPVLTLKQELPAL